MISAWENFLCRTAIFIVAEAVALSDASVLTEKRKRISALSVCGRTDIVIIVFSDASRGGTESG